MTARSDSSRITVPTVSHSTRILTWLMLVLLVGGHWGMLQVVAWTGMLIDYSRDNSFADAVEMTFGGDHRCAICKQVDQGIAAELGTDEHKTPGKVYKTMKLDAVVSGVVVSTPASTTMSLPTTCPHDVPVGIDREPLRRPPRTLG
jgi:hypothetical protein